MTLEYTLFETKDPRTENGGGGPLLVQAIMTLREYGLLPSCSASPPRSPSGPSTRTGRTGAETRASGDHVSGGVTRVCLGMHSGGHPCLVKGLARWHDPVGAYVTPQCRVDHFSFAVRSPSLSCFQTKSFRLTLFLRIRQEYLLRRRRLPYIVSIFCPRR